MAIIRRHEYGYVPEGLAREAELFGRLCVTAGKQEAVQAFLERRLSLVNRHWSEERGSAGASDQ